MTLDTTLDRPRTTAAATAAAVARLSLAEARLYAVLVTACATARSVTLRQLAQVPGPNGHPVGLRGALDAVRDLGDAALVHVRGLALTTPDSPRRPHVPGCAEQTRPQPAPAPAAAVPAPAPAPVPGIRVMHVGTLGRGLFIPATLPDDLRTRAVALGAELRACHNQPPAAPDIVLDRQRRKVAVLTEWAALPEHTSREVQDALSQATQAEQRAQQRHDLWAAREAETTAALDAAAARLTTGQFAEQPAPEDTVGRFKKGMPIPAALPEELRTELLAIADAYQGGGPADRAERLHLAERRTAALAQWAAHPAATHKVINEATRAREALENTRTDC